MDSFNKMLKVYLPIGNKKSSAKQKAKQSLIVSGL